MNAQELARLVVTSLRTARSLNHVRAVEDALADALRWADDEVNGHEDLETLRALAERKII